MPFHGDLGLGDIFDVAKELAPQFLKLQVLRQHTKLAGKAAKAVARGAQPPIMLAGGPAPLSLTQSFGQPVSFPTFEQGFGGGNVQMAADFNIPGTGLGSEVACAPMFTRGRSSGIRPARLVIVPHPETGEPVFFGNLGKPLLFSRDMSAARRVRKLAGRARRASKR